MKKLIIMLIGFSALIAPMTITYAVGEDISGPEIILKQADKILTTTNILDLYSSELGDIEVVSDAYTGYGNVPGNYVVTLGVSEAEVTKEISVNVRQTIGPVIAVTVTDGSYEIILHKNTTLTANQIIDVLINVQYIVVTSSTEITDASAPGNYTFEFYLATVAGVEETYLVTLQVNDSETLTPDINLNPPAPTVEPTTMHPIAKAGSIALVISATVALLAFVGSKINKKRGKKR